MTGNVLLLLSVAPAHISTRVITHEEEGRSVIRGIDQSEVIPSLSSTHRQGAFESEEHL